MFKIISANEEILIPVKLAVPVKDGVYSGNSFTTTDGNSVWVLQRWNSGYVKRFGVAGIFENSREVSIQASNNVRQVLTEQDLINAQPQAEVSLNVGKVNLAELLHDTPYTVDRRSADLVEVHYTKKFEKIRVWFICSLFSNGDVKVEVRLDYAELIRSGQSPIDVSGSIIIFGHTYSINTTMYPNEKLRYNTVGEKFVRWRGQIQYDYTVWHDPKDLQETGFFPEYGMKINFDKALAGACQTYKLGDMCAHRKALPGTGYHPDHGVIPGYDALYVVTGAAAAWKSLLNNAEVACRFPITWRTAEGHIAGPNDNPTGNYKGTTGNLGGSSTFTNGSLVYDDAHNFGIYVAAVLNDDSWYYDAMCGNAMGMYQLNHVENGNGTNRIIQRQVRGTAWTQKQMMACAAALPDEHRLKIEMQEWLSNNIDFWLTKTADDPLASPLGIPYTSDHQHSIDKLQCVPFEQGYWGQVTFLAQLAEPLKDMTNYSRFAEWQSQFITGILGDPQTGYFFGEAALYDITISDISDAGYGRRYARAFYPDWRTVFKNTKGSNYQFDNKLHEPASLTGGISYWYVLWATLQLAVKTNMPLAKETLARMLNADNISTILNQNMAGSNGTISPYAITFESNNTGEIPVPVEPPVVEPEPPVVEPEPPVANIVNNVWTPNRNPNGIPDFENLPINTWVAVGDLKPGEVKQLVKNKYPWFTWNNMVWGNSKSSVWVTISDGSYSGLAFDNRTGFMHNKGDGGHGTTSWDGGYAIDLQKLKFVVTFPPSNPFQPGAEWSQAYKDSKSYTKYIPLLPDTPHPCILPDRQHIGSAHHYRGKAVDTKRDWVFSVRNGFHAVNLTTNEMLFRRFKNKADGKTYVPSIYANVYYNEFHDVYIGAIPDSSSVPRFLEVYPAEMDNEFIPFRFVDTGGTDKATLSSTRMGNKIIFFFAKREISYREAYSIYDLPSRTWDVISKEVLGGPDYDTGKSTVIDPYSAEGAAATYIPEWNKVLRRLCNGDVNMDWYLFDPVSGKVEPYAPEGAKPPRKGKPNDKMRYWNGIVYYVAGVADSSPCLWVMKTGERNIVVDPIPEPEPVDPTPVDPTPVDPTPVDPTPVDPTPVDPTPEPIDPNLLQEVTAKLDSLDKEILSLRNILSGLEGSTSILQSIEPRIFALENEISNLKNTTVTNQVFGARLSIIQQEISNLTTLLSTTVSKNQELENKVLVIEREVSSLANLTSSSNSLYQTLKQFFSTK